MRPQRLQDGMGPNRRIHQSESHPMAHKAPSCPHCVPLEEEQDAAVPVSCAETDHQVTALGWALGKGSPFPVWEEWTFPALGMWKDGELPQKPSPHWPWISLSFGAARKLPSNVWCRWLLPGCPRQLAGFSALQGLKAPTVMVLESSVSLCLSP